MTTGEATIPADWVMVQAERAHYVDNGREKVLCDRLPSPVTLVLKNPVLSGGAFLPSADLEGLRTALADGGGTSAAPKAPLVEQVAWVLLAAAPGRPTKRSAYNCACAVLASLQTVEAETIRKAVEAEREACARVANEKANEIAVRYGDYPLGEQLSEIPAAIRSRRSQKGEG